MVFSYCVGLLSSVYYFFLNTTSSITSSHTTLHLVVPPQVTPQAHTSTRHT